MIGLPTFHIPNVIDPARPAPKERAGSCQAREQQPKSRIGKFSKRNVILNVMQWFMEVGRGYWRYVK